MNIFVTADWHLGHKNCAKWRGLGETHEATIYENYMAVVKAGDTVYVLGDAVWNASGEPWVKKMHGRKILIAGNHDTYKAARYLGMGFDDVKGVKVLDNVLLSHIPLYGGDRWKGNIHGHLHHNKLDSQRHICVSLEQTDYKPVAFEDIAERF